MFFLMPESGSSAAPSSPSSDNSDDSDDSYMHPTTPRYSRSVMAEIINDFYKFITTFHIAESALKIPPPGGWPNIIAESTAGFKKSPYVISLIKHLPYIDDSQSRDAVNNIHYKCDVVDYSNKTAADFASENILLGEMDLEYSVKQAKEYRDDADENTNNDDDVTGNETRNARHSEDVERSGGASSGPLTYTSLAFGADFNGHDDFADEETYHIDMANVICIANGYESYGRMFCLDLITGLVYEDVCRAYSCDGVDIGHFFADLREKFERLQLVPVPSEQCYEVSDNASEDFNTGLIWEIQSEDDIAKQFRKIYRDHGWPGPNYRKTEALAAIEAHRQAREAASQAFDAKSEQEKQQSRDGYRAKRQRMN